MAETTLHEIARWREQAPQLAEGIADDWNLTLGEPYVPGVPSSPDPLGMLIGLLPRLWKSGDGFQSVADEAAWWLERDTPTVADAREPWLAIDPKPLAGERETVASSGRSDWIDTHMETVEWLL